jgi:hypothetical protein
MPTDFLTLGGFVFDGFAAPSEMIFGGWHTLPVHSGQAAQDKDLSWSGHFFGDDAYSKAHITMASEMPSQKVY